jgi:hypothetical protein
MSYSLHVSVLRPVLVKDVFLSTRTVLAHLSKLEKRPEIEWKYPPNPKIRATEENALSAGVSFYVGLKGISEESLVQFGVSDVRRYGLNEPAFASFTVHNFPEQNILALAMAIAVAQLTGSTIEDGSSHWIEEEEAEPKELLRRFRLSKAPSDLSEAIAQIDGLLNWKKRRKT